MGKTYKNADGTPLKNNWLHKGGNEYYFGSSSHRIDDKTITIDGETYHFDVNGILQRDKLIAEDNTVHYFTKGGEEAKDYFYQNWGNTYYFDKTGARYTNKWYSNWGHKYYFGDGGVLYTDTTAKIDGNLYYFDSKGILAQNQTVYANNTTYHADANGVLTEIAPSSFSESQINYTYALGADEGSPYRTYNYYIILHDVGAESGGWANANYLRNNWTSAYTQFVVGDGGEVYQVGETGYISYGALDANAYSPVQIELARTYNRETFIKDYTSYVNVARYYADVYGIPKTLNAGGWLTAGIKTHHWVSMNASGDHVDPDGYLSSWGISLDQLAHDLQNGINQQELENTVYSERQ